MIAVSTSPPNLSMLRKFNVWYSVADGNFNDPSIWISNGKKKHNYPQAGDDVYINFNHKVTIDTNTYSVKNIYVYGYLIFSYSVNSALSVMGNIYAPGVVDMGGTTQATLKLYGFSNYINKYNFINPGISTIIEYSGLNDQDILDLPYVGLTVSGAGYKNVNYSLTVSGPFQLEGSVNFFNKYISNTLIFNGNISLNGSDAKFASFDNTVNATIEIRGNIESDLRHNKILFGTGILYWTGNNYCHIGGGTPYYNYNTMIIKSGKTFTIYPDPSPFVCYGSINGEDPTSTFNVSGGFYQATNIEPMATAGVYNYNYGGTSNLGYIFNGDYTLPHTNYHRLEIQGTGTKSLSGDTIIGEILNLNGDSLDLGNYAITVTSTANISGIIKKETSSTGLILFKGQLVGNAGSARFTVPGTLIEFQNGATWDIRNFSLIAVGGTTFKFTTRSQTLEVGGGTGLRIGADILISGPITITNQNQGFGILGVLNGDNILSKFLNTKFFDYQNLQAPMLTGILDSGSTDTTSCLFQYSLNGNQNITAGIYSNLTLSNGGSKKLLGDVSVLNTYNLNSPATLDTNGYSITNP
ncbi:G8 domain-containing protein [Mucilaginibacter xinganensis]|uniref:G8 domain-containing protein n=1 Tax=Mucilaginibacter xinganensis TaxID=1234841 RepID=A0A223NTD4_9SPHI|nr:G8 domain-containing protein [Mucilaginibacter xinganensis]ASU33142.1 hypothetical protein MuYL_1244 [Mucilaginibacter xinganensis]